MGRESRRSYGLTQVEIVPSRRTRSSQEVSTAWQLDAYHFDIPMMTHPTDAIASPSTAVRIGRLGGLPVLNAEGLWARHADPDRELGRVVDAVADGGPAAAVAVLQELHPAPRGRPPAPPPAPPPPPPAPPPAPRGGGRGARAGGGPGDRGRPGQPAAR